MTKKNDAPADAPEASVTPDEAQEIVYRYIGAGEVINGIPPRDLTALDIENLDLALRREVYVGRFYQAV